MGVGRRLDNSPQEGVCVFRTREEFFFGLEFRRMHAAAAAPQPDRVLQMEHLVVNDVFQHEAGHAGMIEDAADNDRIVRRIVMAEYAAGLSLTPAHARPCHQSMEETAVQVFEDFIQIVKMTSRRSQ